MRFALLGDHPDGLAMSLALVTSGHELLAYCGPAVGAEYLKRWNISPRPVGDMEEILADPAIEAVIVAGKPADRPAQLRRALQAERHVLCVHPADDSPDIAYEAAMIRADVNVQLLPLLPEALHPALGRLAALIRQTTGGRPLIELERTSTETVLLESGTEGHEPSMPGWDVLRLLAGEVVEIVGLSAEEEVVADMPLLLSGRFESGGLFQMTLLPHQPQSRWRIGVRIGIQQMELVFPEGWPGPARITWQDESGNPREETWDNWNPWAGLTQQFKEIMVGWHALKGREDSHHIATLPMPQQGVHQLCWQDEIRCLELDDAARRSVERRRASTLDYQEANEEVGFKGTMTLVGCALLWSSLALLGLAAVFPWLAWAILPVLGLFLLLQVLRWFVLKEGSGVRGQGSEDGSQGSGVRGQRAEE